MSVNRRAAKRDTNEPEIIQALLAIGATVQALSETGTPDLLVGFRGHNFLIEVKTRSGKLTDAQKNWHQDWNGQKAIARTSQEALEIIGAYFKPKSNNT